MRVPVDSLKRYKEDQSQKTRTALVATLDRFERGMLQKLDSGAKLTRRNFGVDSGVPTETAFCRYPPGHSMAGEYRYGDVVRRFANLRAQLKHGCASPAEQKLAEIDELRKRIKELLNTQADQDAALLRSRRVTLELDAIIRAKDRQIAGLKEQITDLECALAEARRATIRPLPAGRE